MVLMDMCTPTWGLPPPNRPFPIDWAWSQGHTINGYGADATRQCPVPVAVPVSITTGHMSMLDSDTSSSHRALSHPRVPWPSWAWRPACRRAPFIGLAACDVTAPIASTHGDCPPGPWEAWVQSGGARGARGVAWGVGSVILGAEPGGSVSTPLSLLEVKAHPQYRGGTPWSQPPEVLPSVGSQNSWAWVGRARVRHQCLPLGLVGR